MAGKSQEPGPAALTEELTEEQRGRVKQRDTDQDRTLVAMQQLEAALGAAAPGREQAWRNEVRTALAVLGEAAREEADNAAQLDSLLSDIACTRPWLRNRVRGLRLLTANSAMPSRAAGRAGRTDRADGGFHRHPPATGLDTGLDTGRAPAPAGPGVRSDLRGLLRRGPLRYAENTHGYPSGQ